MEKIKLLIILFFIYSFIGWIIEVFMFLFSEKKFINRGFLIGPWLPIYGVGSVIVTLLISIGDSDILSVFLKSVLICGILEYFTSFALEKIFNARWWDYTKNKLNLNGRVCLRTLTLFGLGCCILLYILNPLIINFISSFSINILEILIITLSVIFILDLTITVFILFKVKEKLNFALIDATEEINGIFKKVFKKDFVLIQRIFDSFPNLKKIYGNITKKINIK